MSESKVVPITLTEPMLNVFRAYAYANVDVTWQQLWGDLLNAAPSADRGELVGLLNRMPELYSTDGIHWLKSAYPSKLAARAAAALQSAEAGRKDAAKAVIKLCSDVCYELARDHADREKRPYTICAEEILLLSEPAIDAAIAGKNL